jgi:hypothetical protein
MVRSKECPIWRAQIGWKRLLVKDTKTEKLISRIIPNLDDFYKYEECESKRHVKSHESQKRLKEIK